MIGKNDIVKMVRHIHKRGSGIPDRRIMHPARDWFVGLSIATLLFFLVVAYSTWTFLLLSDESERIISVESSLVQYRQERVGEVLETYQEKREEFELLRETTYRTETAPPQQETAIEPATTTVEVAEDEEGG